MSRINAENVKKVIWRMLLLPRKSFYQHLRSYLDSSYLHRRKILFITGCQRSGTSVMQRGFERDMNAKIYGEKSKLSSIEAIRLKSLNEVKAGLRKDKAQLIVLKPLVESQNILKLLDYFEDSKTLWLFRDYRDVAASNLNMFGIKNGINDIRPIAENQTNNWRSEGVSENTRNIIRSHFSENMNPYDAAVLFWYARNMLFFDLGLDANPRVLMCKYEHLIRRPEEVFQHIYKELGQPYPGDKITKEIHAGSFRKGKDIDISHAISDLATDLLKRLDELYLRRWPASQMVLMPQSSDALRNFQL